MPQWMSSQSCCNRYGISIFILRSSSQRTNRPGIGGIKSTNVLRTLHGSVSMTGHALDGVAVVSDIFASSDPSASARKLSTVIRAFQKHSSLLLSTGISSPTLKYSAESIKASTSNLLMTIKNMNPLIHQVIFYEYL